jgi:hypothetical protein
MAERLLDGDRLQPFLVYRKRVAEAVRTTASLPPDWLSQTLM